MHCETTSAAGAASETNVASGSLPALLRGLGALALLVSIGSFLFQRWDGATDFDRFGMLLALTAGLTMLGFASGRWLKEGKGARLFVSIALAAVPANFAVLGAFVYQHWAWDRVAADYPAVALWQIPDAAATWLVLAGALAAVVPLVWLGFMVLARSAAARLSGAFLAANGLLLLPVRDAGWVALLLAGSVLFGLWQVSLRERDRLALATAEGGWALGVLFIPSGLLLGRALWLYSPDAALGVVASLAAFLVLRQVGERLVSGAPRLMLELAAVLPAVMAGCFAWAVLEGHFHGSLAIAGAAASTAGLLFELGARASAYQDGYRRLAALALTLPLVLSLVMFSGIASAALCLIGGIALIVIGYAVRHGFVLTTGVLTLLLGLIDQAENLIRQFDVFGWGSLAAVGIAAILVGSMVDRFGGQLRRRWGKVRQEIAGWSW